MRFVSLRSLAIAAGLGTEYNVVNSSAAFLSIGNEEEVPLETVWGVTLNFSGPYSANDMLIFGENSDASDGYDEYDVPKPGSPPDPCVYAWFNTNLSEPYNRLMKEYKHYPDVSKIWEVRVIWQDVNPANITIYWDPAQLTTEYSVILLKDVDSSVTTDMMVENHYAINASAMTVRHLQIICTMVTEHQDQYH